MGYRQPCDRVVSVLFNESKLLKSPQQRFDDPPPNLRFSTLQRVEIAEILPPARAPRRADRFSTLQRVEIAEMPAPASSGRGRRLRFSTLQRVEIAEM